VEGICYFADGSEDTRCALVDILKWGYARFSSAYYLLLAEALPPIKERVSTGSNATACSTNR
jgi:hypothetical protein